MNSSPFNYYAECDVKRVDVARTLDLLRGTYFGETRTEEELIEQMRNSLCFVAFRRDYIERSGFPSHTDTQIGFARVVTDYVKFGWLADFVIAPADRGHGVGHRLMDIIVSHHSLAGVTLNLCTRDAHEFYAKFGFQRGEHMVRRPA
jgi:GNAT superfamily N-acetyltransferase